MPLISQTPPPALCVSLFYRKTAKNSIHSAQLFEDHNRRVWTSGLSLSSARFKSIVTCHYLYWKKADCGIGFTIYMSRVSVLHCKSLLLQLSTVLAFVLLVVCLSSLLALFINVSEGFHFSGSSMTISNDDRVLSACRELLLGVLFLFINEKMHFSLAFECGIIMMHCATRTNRPNSFSLVPAIIVVP